MQPITKPEPLDPDRPLHDHGTKFLPDDEPQDERLTAALRESCAYADQLWDCLDSMRKYLFDSLPPDPRTADPDSIAAAGASPTGPDDDAGWNGWIDAFAAVTSILCGPNGDSGFGRSRGRAEASTRREGPRREQHPEAGDLGRQPPAAHTADTPAQPSDATIDPSPTEKQPASGQPRSARGTTAGALVLTGFALGVLLPRRARGDGRAA